MGFFKQIKRKKNDTTIEEDYEKSFTKVFGKPYTYKTQTQVEQEKELEQEFSRVFGESEYQKRNNELSKKQSNDRQR